MSDFHTNHKDLKSFYYEINKYSEGIHHLNKGASLKEIHHFEGNHQINLPRVYKDFLQISNGGEIFIPGTVLAEVYIPQVSPRVKGVFYLNPNFNMGDKVVNWSEQYLPIAKLNYGDVICIDLAKNNEYEAQIVQWDIEKSEIPRSWIGFIEWLMDGLEEGAMLVDYEGNEKELDF